MNAVDEEVKNLHNQVVMEPRDPFLRCNLACLLATLGDYRGALAHLGTAMDVADGSMAAGCVAAAVRQVTDEFARLWQLPMSAIQLDLAS